MIQDEALDQAFATTFISEALCRERLGKSKSDADVIRSYLELPAQRRPDISIFFDREYYCARYPDIELAGVDPLLHFLDCGYAEGRAPHPLIDPGHIRLLDEHLLGRGTDIRELCDVLTYNLADPSPYFVLDYYRAHVARSEDVSEGLLAHFLTRGLDTGLKPNPLLDPHWYAARQVDGAVDLLSALRHFVLGGDLAGLAPSPAFSGTRYLRRYKDVADAGFAPLAHYLISGRAEGRDTFPELASAAQAEAAIKAQLDAAADTLNETQLQSVYLTLQDRVAQLRQEQKDDVSVEPLEIHRFSDLPRRIAKLKFPRVKNPVVSILVPAFNEASYTVECLAAILDSQPRASFEVILADDASTDPLLGMLDRVRNLKIVRQSTNVGFIENCNQALSACQGEFLLLLNNDAQLLPGCIDAMLDVFARNVDAAAVGPMILYPDGRLQEAGCTLDRNGVSTMIGLFDDPGQPAYSYERDVQYCSGAALMIRRAEIGDTLFDTAFKPAYCEDADLCLRLLARGLRVIYCPEAKVAHHLSVSTNRASVTRRLQTVTRNQQKLAQKWSDLLEQINKVRVIAFYLPQFHPTPENDFHWGQGFTEWSNVARATPGYVGHYQPHLPADLGFYDLRVKQTIERQSTLAARYGVDGFCVYYYNFGKQRALDQAFEGVVSDQTIPFPYCICWANENWTRHWDGGSREIIFEQLYDEATLRAIVGDAVRYAADPRYIRVDGKPLFLVYRPKLIPDPRVFAAIARAAFREAGHPGVHLVYVESMETASSAMPPAHFGFDACVEFPPHGRSVQAEEPTTILREDFVGTRYDYEATVLAAIRRTAPGYKCYPAVFPSWDNTPRQPQRGDSFVHATPEAFQVYLEEKLEYVRRFFVGDERLLFVNAWNEWAEGTHLEPDRKFGHRWLEAIRSARLLKSFA